MKSADIIGSGITGPMAAIVLVSNPPVYDVNVYDARPSHDLHSDGILGITPDNWLDMLDYGIPLHQFELELNTYTDANAGYTKKSEYHYITWTDLHHAITTRATQLGVKFHYGTPVESPGMGVDVTVWATGVGSAKEVSTPTYTGYTVVRGLAYQYSGTPWTISRHADTLFTVGDTRDGASVTLFVKRSSVQMRTTYSAVAPKEIRDLPVRWSRLFETVPLWQQAPLSDWTVPETLVTHRRPSGAISVRLGDANGQMRPQTSMGANLALNETMNLGQILRPDMLASAAMQAQLLAKRQRQHDLGISLGI